MASSPITSNAASAFKTCVALNTQAIYFTRDGRHRDSSRVLRLSLEFLKPCMGLPTSQNFAVPVRMQCEMEALQEKTELELSRQIEQNQHLSRTHEMPPCVASVTIEHVLQHIDPLLLETNALVFCPRMFYVSLTDAHKLGLSKVFLIILYNQAVLKHVQTLLYMTYCKKQAGGTSPSHYHCPQALLSSVHRLYQSTLDISLSFSPQDCHQLTGVLAATANNAGHVASSLHLHQDTNVYIKLLKDLMTTHTTHRFAAAPGSLPLDCESLFFESLCIFLEGKDGDFLTLAAAA